MDCVETGVCRVRLPHLRTTAQAHSHHEASCHAPTLPACACDGRCEGARHASCNEVNLNRNANSRHHSSPTPCAAWNTPMWISQTTAVCLVPTTRGLGAQHDSGAPPSNDETKLTFVAELWYLAIKVPNATLTHETAHLLSPGRGMRFCSQLSMLTLVLRRCVGIG